MYCGNIILFLVGASLVARMIDATSHPVKAKEANSVAGEANGNKFDFSMTKANPISWKNPETDDNGGEHIVGKRQSLYKRRYCGGATEGECLRACSLRGRRCYSCTSRSCYCGDDFC